MNLVSPSRRQNLQTATSTFRVPELISPRIFLAAAFCLAGIVFAVYSPALDFQFILDDHRFTADPRIQFSGHVWDYFSDYVWAQFTGGPPSFYRPLFILWMRVNFMLSALSPWGWHFTSIIAHVAVATLLGLLVWRLLHDRAAALLAASLFALHPAQAESVAWVTVPDPLMSACILGSMILYRKYAATPRLSQPPAKKSRKSSRPNEASADSVWVLAASVSLCFLALLTKETAIVVPVIIFALALCAPQNNARWNVKSEADSKSIFFLRKAIRETLPFAGVTAIYLLMRFHALGGRFGSLTQHLPWNTVLLSWPATLWFYLKVLVWPAHSHAFADPTLADRFSFDGVLLPVMAVICVVAIFASAWRWAWRKAERELSGQEASGVEFALVIGTLLLVLPILPALHLNALNPGDFLHGRYTYLPSAGLMVLVATAWHLSGKLRVPLLCAAGSASHPLRGAGSLAGTAVERRSDRFYRGPQSRAPQRSRRSKSCECSCASSPAASRRRPVQRSDPGLPASHAWNIRRTGTHGRASVFVLSSSTIS